MVVGRGLVTINW